MAVSQGCGLLRRTFCCFTNSYLPSSRIRIATFSLKTYTPFVTTQKRFCSSQDGADADQAKASGPRNLLEVYKNEPSLLDGPRNALKPLTEEHIEKERRKSRKVRLRTPVKIDPDKVGWTTGSRRVGTIGVKLGMSALWLKDGRRVPVTLLQIKDCQVVQTRISRHHGGKDHKTELQVGAFDENDLYKVKKSQFGHFRKHGMNPKKKVRSFSVTRNALLHPGTCLYAAHYYPGQYVKIQGVTKDRGFQGVMKRWKMKGQPQSHGQTKTHRKMGASGGGTNPGRIFPGKRMAGHMGNKNCTKFAVRVSISVDVFNNYGSGSVGGASFIAFYDNGQLCLRECSLFLVGGLVNESNQ
ncbi:LOW QUALITY PROTEIN: 50S ribosomal protein L3-like [Acropora millepora]|uniref:LOW QUALITY PROTEIN: 50S ribosomal protein L3-like n=1 Tax=Acropora millepora TaxID=45264 RepID=UPI001CF452D9|nr:LOW QUALITY PROTEIN: 50S ribosomal protein L3-like [Acropora millepora]